jgi:hypothetical protein
MRIGEDDSNGEILTLYVFACVVVAVVVGKCWSLLTLLFVRLLFSWDVLLAVLLCEGRIFELTLKSSLVDHGVTNQTFLSLLA